MNKVTLYIYKNVKSNDFLIERFVDSRATAKFIKLSSTQMQEAGLNIIIKIQCRPKNRRGGPGQSDHTILHELEFTSGATFLIECSDFRHSEERLTVPPNTALEPTAP